MNLADIKEVLNNSKNFHESANYYFHMHECPETNDTIKVTMDYKLANETDDKIIKFGCCPYCKDVFFHKDFESRSL